MGRITRPQWFSGPNPGKTFTVTTNGSDISLCFGKQPIFTVQ